MESPTARSGYILDFDGVIVDTNHSTTARFNAFSNPWGLDFHGQNTRKPIWDSMTGTRLWKPSQVPKSAVS